MNPVLDAPIVEVGALEVVVVVQNQRDRGRAQREAVRQVEILLLVVTVEGIGTLGAQCERAIAELHVRFDVRFIAPDGAPPVVLRHELPPYRPGYGRVLRASGGGRANQASRHRQEADQTVDTSHRVR